MYVIIEENLWENEPRPETMVLRVTDSEEKAREWIEKHIAATDPELSWKWNGAGRKCSAFDKYGDDLSYLILDVVEL